MNLKGLKEGDWYEDKYIGGFVRSDGSINICLEKELTDADTDAYAIDVMNGSGYYDSNGKYRSIRKRCVNGSKEGNQIFNRCGNRR